jgi:hypothetical protein
MAVNFPIPDYRDIETLTEMVSRVLIPYSSELGLDVSFGPTRQPTGPGSRESGDRTSREDASEDWQSH